MSAVSVKLRPLDDRVVVKALAREAVTKSGIVLPDTAKEKPQEGEILAVGPGKVLDNGKRTALEAQVGQRVLFANDRAVQLLELHNQPVVGRKLWEVSRRRALQKVVRLALSEVETCREELTWEGSPPRHCSGAA